MNAPGLPLRFARRTSAAGGVWWRLLLLSLLAQALLPVQAHSQWQHDSQGRLVELCTLQGAQTVRIDPDSGAPLPAAPEHGFSPAMAFSGLLSHAAVASFLPPAAIPERFALPVVPRVLRVPLAPELPDAAIRGPPIKLA